MTSLPPVKDHFNISPEEEAQVLDFVNRQFKTRFTDVDRAFQTALTKDPENPLIVENWVGLTGRRNQHRNKFVEGSEFRGRGRGRGNRGRGEWRGGFEGGRGRGGGFERGRGRGGGFERGRGRGSFENGRGRGGSFDNGRGGFVGEPRGGGGGRGRGEGDGFRGRGRGRGGDRDDSPGMGRGRGRGRGDDRSGSHAVGRGKGDVGDPGDPGDPAPPVVGLKRPRPADDSRSSSPALKSKRPEDVEIDKNDDRKREEDDDDVKSKGDRRRDDQGRQSRKSPDHSRSRSRSRSGSRSRSQDHDDKNRFDDDGKWRSIGPKRGRFYHRKRGYEYQEAYQDRDNPESWPEEIDPFAAELARAQERLGLTKTGDAAASTSANKSGDDEESGDDDISKYDLYADERSDGEIPSD